MKRKGTFRVVLLFGFCLSVVLGIYQESVAAPGGGAKRQADFTRFVIVGDSVSAGVQNFSLNKDSQPNSYATLIARQKGANLPLPLIANPGVPPPLELVSVSPLVLKQEPGIPCLQPDTGVLTCRVDPFLPPYNISVPNLKIDEVLSYQPDCVPDPSVGGIRLVDVYVELILGLPGCANGSGNVHSEVDTAVALQPTFVILWVGNNDTLWAVVNGVTSEITDENTFKDDYEEIVRRLVATGAGIVIGNLPDATTLPHLTSAEDLAAMLGVDMATVNYLFGIGAGDYVTLSAFDTIKKILNSELPPGLPDALVVSADELAVIQAKNLKFNSIVYDVASRYNIPVADIRGLMQEVYEKGIVVGGQRLTLDYLGGIFTLDGFHPTNTGHAIVANKFIKTINRYYKADIPLVDVEAIKEADPLVFPDTGYPPSSIQ